MAYFVVEGASELHSAQLAAGRPLLLSEVLAIFASIRYATPGAV